jgi:general L-amino acid transport system substrate-binding protein
MLGLSNDFIARVIRHVGNYGEVYDRNLSTFNLARGQNELWTNGGLMYSPPFR